MITGPSFVKALAAVALFNGDATRLSPDGSHRGRREEEARKYTEDLRKGKDAKAKVTALKELGNLAAIQKSLVEPRAAGHLQGARGQGRRHPCRGRTLPGPVR